MWPLLEVIDACLGRAVVPRRSRSTSAPAPTDHGRGRRCAAAAHWPGCSARYAAHRPQMLRAWADGADTDGDGRRSPTTCLAGRAVAAAARARSAPEPGRAARRRTARALRGRPGAGRPARAGSRVFGPTRLPADALAGAGRARRAPRRAPLAAAPDPRAVGARSQGRDRRSLRREDDDADAAPTTRCCAASAATSASCSCGSPTRTTDRRTTADAPTPPTTLLGRLQARPAPTTACPPSRRALDRRPQRPGARLPRPARQVEVLREVLVGLLADDPTLEPRDVLVMCPDIETFAPLIAAAFGARAEDDAAHPAAPAAGPARRPRRCARPTRCSPSWRQLLELAGGRVTAAQVLDLAATPRRAAAVRVRRRRARAAARLGRARRGPLGPRRRAPRRRSDWTAFAQNTWQRRARPAAARRRDGRGRPPAGSGRACRSTTSTAATSTWPAGSPSCVDRLDGALTDAERRAPGRGSG